MATSISTSPLVPAMPPGTPCRSVYARSSPAPVGRNCATCRSPSGYKGFYARMYGVLELHLQKDRYEYDFRTLDRGIRDSGSAQCRRSR